MRSRSLALALVVMLAVPAVTYAQPSQAPRLAPEQLTPRDEESRSPYEQPLFIAGAFTLLTSYGLSFGVAAQSLDTDNRALYMPIVGPWLALSPSEPCDGECSDNTRDVLLVLDGITQATGVALMAASLLGHGKRASLRGARLAITSKTVGIRAQF
jgi:hypothetical protein